MMHTCISFVNTICSMWKTVEGGQDFNNKDAARCTQGLLGWKVLYFMGAHMDRYAVTIPLDATKIE